MTKVRTVHGGKARRRVLGELGLGRRGKMRGIGMGGVGCGVCVGCVGGLPLGCCGGVGGFVGGGGVSRGEFVVNANKI